MNYAREWPLQFRRYYHEEPGVSAVSVGGGWAQFVADHHLGDGAFLTFEVVDDRSLVVALHARGVVRSNHSPEQERIVGALSQPPRSDHVPPTEDTRDPPQSVRGALTEFPSEHRPQFLKKLRKTHMKKNDGGRLVSTALKSLNCLHPTGLYRVFVDLRSPAGSFGSTSSTPNKAMCACLWWAQDVPTQYWRAHGVEAFDGKWYTFYGPMSTGYVKTATHSSLKQWFCSFTKGFAAFCEANGLKLGDTAQFTKVGALEYEVRKV